MAVMVAKMAPMISHCACTQCGGYKLRMGGMSWLQYAWRLRREMIAEGVKLWQKCDPWHSPSWLPKTTIKDCFAINSLQGQRSHQLGFGSIYLTQVTTDSRSLLISSVMEKKVYSVSRHTDVQCARRRTMASAHAHPGIRGARGRACCTATEESK